MSTTAAGGPLSVTEIPHGRLRRVVVPALVVYALAWIPFLVVGEASELVRLQLSGSEASAREVVDGWSRAEAVDAGILVGVDGVHLVAYGVLLSAAAVWAGRRLEGRLRRRSGLVAWLAVVAAGFDVIENAGTITMIRGHFEPPVPTMTTAFALAKYSLLLVVVAYALAGLAARIRSSADSRRARRHQTFSTADGVRP